jgi:hypothetical protein
VVDTCCYCIPNVAAIFLSIPSFSCVLTVAGVPAIAGIPVFAGVPAWLVPAIDSVHAVALVTSVDAGY